MARAPLSSISGEMAGLMNKGDAVAVPAAAVPAAAAVPMSASPARVVLPAHTLPQPQPRAAARVQLGLRLTPERHARLCEIAIELGVPIQAVIEHALIGYMDAIEAGRRSSRKAGEGR